MRQENHLDAATGWQLKVECSDFESGAIGTIYQKSVEGYEFAWVRQDFLIRSCSVDAFEMLILDIEGYLKKNPQIKKYQVLDCQHDKVTVYSRS